MNRFFLTLFVLLAPFGVLAEKFEPKPVTVQDLQQKEHPTDKSAPAAFLFKVGTSNINFNENSGFETRHQFKTRIKIYNKEGYEWAMQHVYYATTGRGVVVSFDDVFTYNLVDGKIVKTPLKKDGIFTEKITKYISERKFQFPDVREGSILEFTYTISGMGVITPPKWTYQSKIPVDYAELKTQISDYLTFATNQKGTFFAKVTKSTTQQGQHPANVVFYKAEHIPALKDEGFVTNIDNYTAGINHELSGVRLPAQYSFYSERFAGDWETIAKRLYEYEDFGGEIKRTGFFEKQVDSLVKGLSTQQEIIKAVFDYTKSRVKWNKAMGFACDQGIKRAFKEHSGNVADINLLLVAMLRHLEIEASPVLVSTRKNGIVFFPSIDNFDYVIAGVQTISGFVLLDATESFALPDLLPTRDLNWFGRLVRQNGTSEQIDLIPATVSRETVFLSADIDPITGSIVGKMRKQYADYPALEFREKNVGVTQESYLERLEMGFGGLEIENYQRENEKEVALPLAEKFTFKDKSALEVINDKIYFSPMLFLKLKENPFKQETREYPVDFSFPLQSRFTATIQIPAGYVVESVPEPIALDTENGFGSFRFNIIQQPNAIQISVTTETKTVLVAPEYYTLIKSFYQTMVEKESEKVVLRKS